MNVKRLVGNTETSKGFPTSNTVFLVFLTNIAKKKLLGAFITKIAIQKLFGIFLTRIAPQKPRMATTTIRPLSKLAIILNFIDTYHWKIAKEIFKGIVF